jgi:hypothetical protein
MATKMGTLRVPLGKLFENVSTILRRMAEGGGFEPPDRGLSPYNGLEFPPLLRLIPLVPAARFLPSFKKWGGPLLIVKKTPYRPASRLPDACSMMCTN